MSLTQSDADKPTGQPASATHGAHAMIGLCLSVIALWIGFGPLAVAWGVPGLYFLGKELLFDIRLDSRPRVVLDSILDAVMTGLGSALIYSLGPVVDGYDALIAAGILAILAFTVFADRWR